MESPTERISKLTAQAIDQIEDKYGQDATVGTCILVCDVIAGDTEAINPIVYYSNDPRRWVQSALLREGSEVAESQNEMRILEAEPPDDD